MKNLKKISVLLVLIALFVIAGCTKAPAPVPTPEAPVITLSGVPTDTLPYANSVSFSWEISGKVDSTLLNNKRVAQNGNFTSGRLLADQSYTLRATGPGGSDSKTVSVKVGDWTTSVWGMINHSFWRRTQSYMISHDPVYGDIKYVVDLTAVDKSIQWFFKSDGFIYFYYPDGTVWGSGPPDSWSISIDEKKFIWGPYPYKIKKINPSNFQIYREIVWDSLPATEYYVFKR